jgi:hypothetical protein
MTWLVLRKNAARRTCKLSKLRAALDFLRNITLLASPMLPPYLSILLLLAYCRSICISLGGRNIHLTKYLLDRGHLRLDGFFLSD